VHLAVGKENTAKFHMPISSTVGMGLYTQANQCTQKEERTPCSVQPSGIGQADLLSGNLRVAATERGAATVVSDPRQQLECGRDMKVTGPDLTQVILS